MKVKELIEKLKQQPQDADVIYCDSHFGYTEVETVKYNHHREDNTVELNATEWI